MNDDSVTWTQVMLLSVAALTIYVLGKMAKRLDKLEHPEKETQDARS